LKLVIRYLSQARELGKLTGADNIIKIETCESRRPAKFCEFSVIECAAAAEAKWCWKR